MFESLYNKLKGKQRARVQSGDAVQPNHIMVVIWACVWAGAVITLLNFACETCAPGVRDIWFELEHGWDRHVLLFDSNSGQGYWRGFVSSGISVALAVFSGVLLSVILVILLPTKSGIFRKILLFSNMARLTPPLVLAPILIVVLRGPLTIDSPDQSELWRIFVSSIPGAIIAGIYVFSSCAFSLSESILDESRHARREEMQRLYKLNQVRFLSLVLFPSLLEKFIRDLRIIVPIAVGVVVVVDYLNASGIGFALRKGQSLADMKLIFASMALSTLLAVLFDLMIQLFMKFLWLVHVLQGTGAWQKTAAGLVAVKNLIFWFPPITPARIFRVVLGIKQHFDKARGYLLDGNNWSFGNRLAGVALFLQACGFVALWWQLDDDKRYQSWIALNAAHDRPGDSGRRDALTILMDQDVILDGIDIKKAYIHDLTFNAKSMKDVQFASAKIFKSKFDGTNLKQAQFEAAEIFETDFVHIGISNVSFKHANLTDVAFTFDPAEEANATDPNFNYLNFRRLQFMSATLASPRFQSAFGNSLTFKGSYMTGGDFRCSRIRNLKFVGSEVLGVEFGGTDITNAVFSGTRLDDVDFSFSNLNNAMFRRDIDEAEVQSSGFSGKAVPENAAVFSRLRFPGANLRDAVFDIGVAREASDFEVMVTDARGANIYGMRPLSGDSDDAAFNRFREWLMTEKGAVEVASDREWERERDKMRASKVFEAYGKRVSCVAMDDTSNLNTETVK